MVEIRGSSAQPFRHFVYFYLLSFISLRRFSITSMLIIMGLNLVAIPLLPLNFIPHLKRSLLTCSRINNLPLIGKTKVCGQKSCLMVLMLCGFGWPQVFFAF